MTDAYGPTTRHYDLSNPADLAELVQTRPFWTASGPQTLLKAAEAIAKGDAPFVAAVVPPQAVKLIDSFRHQLGKPPIEGAPPAAEQESPAEDQTEPAEEPVAPDVESPVEDAAEPQEEPPSAPTP